MTQEPEIKIAWHVPHLFVCICISLAQDSIIRPSLEEGDVEGRSDVVDELEHEHLQTEAVLVLALVSQQL